MSFSNLDDVFYHALKDLLSAEKQFRDALTKLSKTAEDSDLSEAFASHHEETKTQIDRLEKCFELIGKSPRSEKCEAAEGLVQEGSEIMQEGGESPALGVMLVAAGRKTEYYEIVSYTDAINFAKVLGYSEAADLLQQTLSEEENAASKLDKIGQRLAKSAAG